MGQNPGDKKSQPSLELPSFPGMGRRKKRARRREEPAHEPRDETQSLEPAETQSLEPAEPQPGPSAEPQPSARKPVRRARRADSRRFSLSGRVAAGLAGLLVGVAGGAGTYGVLAGCEAVRGVSTCGGGPGFFLLLAILAVMVLLGAALLKAFGVAAPASTSFLAVGIMTVVVMLVLLEVVYSPWMFVVVPALAIASYLLAHWVTTRFDAATPQRPDWT